MVVSVLILGLVELTYGGLDKARCHTEQCEEPHPKDRSGASDEDGEDGSGDVSDTDTVTHTDAEDLQGRNLALVGAFLGECYPPLPPLPPSPPSNPSVASDPAYHPVPNG